MPRYGITDIENFAEKIRFSLLLLSPRALVEKVLDGGGQLTITTINAWRAGQNLPSYPKLRQFCRLIPAQMCGYAVNDRHGRFRERGPAATGFAFFENQFHKTASSALASPLISSRVRFSVTATSS